MSLKTTFLAGLAAVTLAMPAFADGIKIHDAYARAASPNAMAGAAFFEIINDGDSDDRLVDAFSDIAKRVELHTHIETDDGIMQMRKVEDGFPVTAGANHMLMRGGDHVMFMGLTGSMVHGEMISVTLVFEQAGEITVDIPVDLERKPMDGAMEMDHSTMDHDAEDADASDD